MSHLEIAPSIRNLICKSGKTTKDIADGAGVSRHALWNFVSGRTPTIDVDSASKVKFFLTGEALK